MKRLVIKLVQAVFNLLHSNKRFYSFFYFLYLQGLKGMDHGYLYIYPENSGEYDVLKKVALFYGQKKIVFFDIGANIGYYSKKVLEIFGGHVYIYCFEPSAFTYQQLTSNLGNSVRAFQLALSSRSGTSSLYSDKEGSGMASLEDTTYAPPFGIAPTSMESVTLDTVDNFCSTHSISKIHFLKMDVEGHEYSVLEGSMEKLKQKSIDFIQFEFGRVNIDSCIPLKKFYKLLHEHYDIYRIIQTGLIPQFVYHYEYEIYLGTNFLAISKSLRGDDRLKIIID